MQKMRQLKNLVACGGRSSKGLDKKTCPVFIIQEGWTIESLRARQAKKAGRLGQLIESDLAANSGFLDVAALRVEVR